MIFRKLTFLLFFVLSLSLQGQNYQFTNFSLLEGLPQSQVFCIHEDIDGYLWMGTRGGGITRFTGLNFETFTTQNGLSGNYINAICTNGDVLAATDAGLSFFKHGQWTSIPAFKNKMVSDIRFNDETLWVISEGRVFNLDSNYNVDTLFKAFNDIKNIEFSKSGEGWLIGKNKTVRLSDTAMVRIKKPVECASSDAYNGLWIGTYGAGLYYYKETLKFDVNELLNLEDAVIHNLYLEDETLWIATLQKGVCRFNMQDSTFVYLNEAEGLANNHARVTIKDSWGNYWIGTSGGGVSKYGGQPFSKFGTKTKLKGDYIYSIFEDSQNRKWVGTSGGGVNIWDSTVSHLNAWNGYLNQKTKAIFESQDSLIWLGSDDGGLAIYTCDTIIKLNANNGLSSNWIKTFVEDESQNIWAASAGGGIIKIMRDSLYFNLKTEWYKRSKGLLSNRISDLEVDSKNRIWYATQNQGIGFIENSKILNYTLADGLNSNSPRCLLRMDDILWIGTTRGLNFIDLSQDSLEIESVESELALSSQNMYLLQNDLNGNLWIGSEKGLDRVKLDGTSFLEIDHFNASNGFEGVETNLNASMLDAQGGLWFGTINGLFKYNNEGDLKNTVPPKLSWVEILINNKPAENPLNSSKELDTSILPYGRNRVSFDFIGINHSSPKEVKYRWKLLGWDNTFNDPTVNHFIEYGGLTPGNYRFVVEAMNEDGLWTENDLSFSFQVETPIWQTKWFIGLSIVFVAGVLFTFYRWRISISNKKSAEREEKLELEKNLVQLEQKALQLQMNPHFIFHTLNSIQELIATKEEKVARRYLTQFSKLMRQILDGSRNNTTSLSSEIKMLTNYLALEKFSHEDRFDFEISCESDELDFISIPSMIIQPFVENALIHGALKAEKAGKVSVQFQVFEKEVKCIILDNGPGLGKNTSDHKSSAIEITKERLLMLSGKENSVELQNRKENGVEAIVHLPIIEENETV